jgi:hypothetical protein
MWTFWNILKVTLAVLLAGVAIYAFVVYAVPWLPAVAVAVYSCIALLRFGVLLYSLRNLQKSRSEGEELLQRTQRELAHKSVPAFLAYYGRLLGIVLALIADALIWPVSRLIEFYLQAQIGAAASDARKALLSAAGVLCEHLQSFGVLVWVLLSISLAQISFIGDRYPRIFVFTLLASILFRLVALIVIPGGLPEILRRKTTWPWSYAVFFLIVSLDAISLVAGCHYLRVSDPSGAVVAGGLSHTAELVLHPVSLTEHALSVLRGQRIEWQGLSFTAVGFIFYLSFTKNLMNFGNFQRQDTDRVALAESEIKLGRPAKALRLLDEITPANVMMPAALLVRSLALIALSEYGRAKSLISKILETEIDGLGPPSDDQLFSVLLGWTAIFVLPPKVGAGLVKWGADNGASDWVLANMAGTILALPLQGGGTPADVLPVAEQMEQLLAPRLTTAPLTAAVIKINLGQLDDARTRLAAARPNHPIEALIHDVLLMQTMVLDPDKTLEERKAGFSSWIDSAVPVLKGQVGELKEWHEQLAALKTLYALRSEAIQLECDPEQFTYLANRLADQLRSRKGLDVIVQSLEQMAAG